MEQNKKTVLVTGATSGIGEAIAKELRKRGYPLLLVVRNEQKARGIYGDGPDVRIISCDLESTESVARVIQQLYREGVVLYGVILAAGGAPENEQGEKMFNDSQYPGGTKQIREENAYNVLRRINVVTKETFLEAFEKAYIDRTVAKKFLAFGSHAAHFKKGHPHRADQEGYVLTMFDKHTLIEELREKEAKREVRLFEEIYLEEPGLVRTNLTEGSPFLAGLLKTQPSKEAHEYATETLDKTGFI